MTRLPELDEVLVHYIDLDTDAMLGEEILSVREFEERYSLTEGQPGGVCVEVFSGSEARPEPKVQKVYISVEVSGRL